MKTAPMQHINLGQSGLKVSRIGLGTLSFGSSKSRPWILDEAESRPFIRRALDLGINYFDTSNSYSLGVSEGVVGRALKEMAKRDEVVIATKVYFPMSEKPNDRGLSRKHILASIDASLKRLGTDYVDLYQIHRWDAETPIEETLAALDAVVRAGKARYLGASSMLAWQFAEALHTAGRRGWTRFVSMQNQYNLAYREEERDMIPLCREEGIGIVPYSPLAAGVLTGSRRYPGVGDTPRGRNDALVAKYYGEEQCYAIAARVAEVAKKRGVAPAQVALAWLLAQPGLTAPIIGVTRMEQLEQAAGALGVVLADDERAHLEELYRPRALMM